MEGTRTVQMKESTFNLLTELGTLVLELERKHMHSFGRGTQKKVQELARKYIDVSKDLVRSDTPIV